MKRFVLILAVLLASSFCLKLAQHTPFDANHDTTLSHHVMSHHDITAKKNILG